MAFPINPVEGDTYTENNTVWIYSAVAGQWNRSIISQVNETTYIGSDGAPGGIGGNTQVIFNDNGSLASDAGLVFNKTTDALTIAGPVIHSLGTAALPAITPSGDPNTGIYSPGADQVAISTNGTGRLFVDSSGNVGIGASPSTQFTVFGNTHNVRIQQTTGSASDVHGYEITTGASTVEASFKARGSTGELRISTGRSVGWGGFTSFYTDTTEKMRLTSAGRLGLGTSSPQVLLHGTTSVSAATEYAGVGFLENSLNNVDTGATVAYPVLKLTRAGKSGVSFRSSAQFGIARYEAVGTAARTRLDIALGHGDAAQPDTTVMSLLSSGAVGIGTTGPSQLLHLSGGDALIAKTSGYASLYFNAAGIDTARAGAIKKNYDSPFDLRIQGGNNATAAPICFDRADGSENARFDTSGRLLVGTSTTSSICTAILQGRSDSTTEAALLRLVKGTTSVADGNGIGTIAFSDSGHVTAATISSNRDGGTWTSGSSQPTRLVFSTTADGASSPTERLRITSAGVLQIADAGNIAVGTTTGTKIGTATTQKLGFFNKTPVVQPTAVADATDAASVITQLNALLSRMRDLGLIAT